MKKIVFAFLLFGFALQGQAQKLAPVKWAYQAVKTGEKQYNIIITANVDAPWHIYSQFVKKGPVPTTLQFAKNPLVVLKGSTKEVGNLEKKFDNNFGAPGQNASELCRVKINLPFKQDREASNSDLGKCA